MADGPGWPGDSCHEGINFPISNIDPQSFEGMVCYSSNSVLLGRI